MKSKKFVYFEKDIKQLKKDIVARVFFSIAFLAVFVWQFISMFIKHNENTLTNMQTIFSVCVLISSISLFAITFLYAFKDFRIIASIRLNGRCVSSVQILFSTKKTSFIRLYQALITFLTLATSLVLIACITYAILQYSYLSKISFYLPTLILICMAGYNAIYHIKDEIHTQRTVQEQQPLY